MKYSDGREVLIGDKVLAFNSEGTVVCVIDTKQFSDAYPEGWDYLQTGMLIETKAMGLVHCPEVDDRVFFVERAMFQLK